MNIFFFFSPPRNLPSRRLVRAALTPGTNTQISIKGTETAGLRGRAMRTRHSLEFGFARIRTQSRCYGSPRFPFASLNFSSKARRVYPQLRANINVNVKTHFSSKVPECNESLRFHCARGRIVPDCTERYETKLYHSRLEGRFSIRF